MRRSLGGWLLGCVMVVSGRPLAAQDTLLIGTVTNLGYDGVSGGHTGSLLLTAGVNDSTTVMRLRIGAPLGGSGEADVSAWRDTILVRSISPTGDTIAWLGWRLRAGSMNAGVAGTYRIYGGPYQGQGGRWEAKLGTIGQRYLKDRAVAVRPSHMAETDLVRLFTPFLKADPAAPAKNPFRTDTPPAPSAGRVVTTDARTRQQASPASGVPPLTTEAIAARAVPATVTIVTFDEAGDTLGMGSGFLVRPTGVVVTNFHVMAGATRAAVILTSGERYERVEALDTDAGADLAILKIPGYGLPALSTTPALPPVGAKLVAVGNPLGLSRTVSEGIVSAVRLVDGRQILQMSAAISPGSSGGPVLNVRGEVVAIATSYLKDGQNLNFAVPVRYAMGLVDAGRAPVALDRAFGLTERDPPAARSDDDRASRPTRTGRPPRTNRPRPTVTGTWEFAERVARDEGPTVEFVGYLFLGANDLGLAAMMVDGAKDGHVNIFAVQSHTATADGRLSIEIGGMVLDGYQTDEGFYVEGDRPGKDGTLRAAAVATPGELALSTPSGLYDIEGSTRMHFKRGSPEIVRWTGEAAVVVANDSIYIDLFMTNEAGGAASASGSGPLSDDRFDITTPTKERLKGRMANGRLYAEWTDEREWGRYQGALTARRK